MSKINKLTEEQESRLVEWKDRWIKIGLTTGEMDFERFEKAARACYKFAGLNSNVPIIRVSSPMVGALAAPIAALVIEQLTKKKSSAVDSEVRSAVGSAVGSAVNSAVDSAVRSAVYSAVYSAKPKIFWHYWLGGQLWPAWASFTTFFTDVCGYKFKSDVNQRIAVYAEIIQSACYWWPNQSFIMVCERPQEIHRDQNGQLHNDSGLAIKWPDGWGLWMLHGTKVSERIVLHTEELSADEISNEKNSEVSRAIAEKLGWDRYMKVLGTTLIDKWFDPSKCLHYELYDFKERKFSLMPRLLKMESPEIHDGTRPYYIEPVDPGLKSCQAARRWQFQKENGEWPTVQECNENPSLVFEIEA